MHSPHCPQTPGRSHPAATMTSQLQREIRRKDMRMPQKRKSFGGRQVPCIGAMLQGHTCTIGLKKKKKSYAGLVELLQGANTTAAVPARVS